MRRYVVSVFLLATPLAVGFLFVSGGPLVFVLLALLGFVLVSTFTVSVVLGQAYLPKHPGMASGLIVGFAIGAGGVGASALGLGGRSLGAHGGPRHLRGHAAGRLPGRPVPPGSPDRWHWISSRTASRSC